MRSVRGVTASEIRFLASSMILEKPLELENLDVVILLGFGCAAKYLFPFIRVPGEPVDFNQLANARVRGVMNVVSAAPEIAKQAGLDPPADRAFGPSFGWWVVRTINTWEDGLDPSTLRGAEVSRRLKLIDRVGVLLPDIPRSKRTLTGVLADSTGEDYDPLREGPRNGEFAEAGVEGHGRGRLLGAFLRFLPMSDQETSAFRWSEAGLELDRKVLGGVVKSSIGKEPRRKKGTLSLYELEGSAFSPSESHCPPTPDFLADLRDLRDEADSVPELRELLDAIFDETEAHDADGAHRALVSTRRLVRLVTEEEDPAMQAAILHACRRGSREYLAKQFGVTTKAIRLREDPARNMVLGIFAA